jgi:hypothetical protein
MSLDQLLLLVGGLGGAGFLIAVLINIGKSVGWIKDGDAASYSTGASLLLTVIVFVTGIVKPDFDFVAADATVMQIAQILSMVFTALWPMIASKISHGLLRGSAVIGKSYSLENAAAIKMQSAKSVYGDMIRRETK